MAGAIWTVFSLLGNDPHIQHELVDQLGDTCEILVFLIGAMTIVDLIDSYGGFNVITDHITTRNKRNRCGCWRSSPSSCRPHWTT